MSAKSLVSRVKSNNNAAGGDEDAESAELVALVRARNALRADAARVSDSLTELVDSDERFLTRSQRSGAAYDEKLRAAEKRVREIARREQLDNKILWWSFAAFFLVVAMVWSHRLFNVTPWSFFVSR